MAHTHSVFDSDTHFLIDPEERMITGGSTTLIQSDHNSERFTFAIPKEIEGHDMSSCNLVQIHYVNVDSATKAKHADVFEVTDMAISSDDESLLVFSWLISGNATQYAGNLSFSVRFACVADDGTIEYLWNTAICSTVKVAPSYSNSEGVVVQYSDALEQMEANVTESCKEYIDESIANGEW